ncbi:mechanosensitive ion channel family protein [Rhodovibrionaceae bacterium A322]
MDNEVEMLVQDIVDTIALYGLSVLGGIAILIIGLLAAKWMSGMTDKALRRTGKIDDTLRPFLVSLVRYFVLAITVLAVLSEFGVQTASLIAVFGAAGLAIGLALQGTLSNVAAGVMLLIFRPFKVGDFIEAGGESGTVKALTLFVTELATPDNVQIIVPNGQLWGSSVKNYSFNSTRRCDISVGIGYGEDIGKARKLILDTVNKDSRAHKDPAAMVALVGLGDSSVDLQVRIWCNASDYWDLKFEQTQAIKEALDKAGVDIPFPQRVVHMQAAAD